MPSSSRAGGQHTVRAGRHDWPGRSSRARCSAACSTSRPACVREAWSTSRRTPAQVLHGVASALWEARRSTAAPAVRTMGSTMSLHGRAQGNARVCALRRRLALLRTAPGWIVGRSMASRVCAMNYGSTACAVVRARLSLHTATMAGVGWPTAQHRHSVLRLAQIVSGVRARATHMKTRTVTMILCAAVVALCALTGARAAQQRVNATSNTERGGADVKQVPGKKIGNIKTARQHHSPRARRGRHSAEPVRSRQAHPPVHACRAEAGARRTVGEQASARRTCRFSGTRRPARRFRATKSASRSSSSRSPAGTGTR